MAGQPQDKLLPMQMPPDPKFLAMGHSAVEWETVTRQLYPAATDPDVIVLAATICKANNLPLLKKPLHIVPMWDAKKNAMVDTIWPGVALYEIEAHRTGQFAGADPIEYGPMVEVQVGFAGEVDVWSNRQKIKKKIDTRTTLRVPEWACATVYRLVDGQRMAFSSDRLYFEEWVQTSKSGEKTGLPNDVWKKKPRFMLGKCALAAALRLAFPEQTGSLPTAEEMEGGELNGDYVDTSYTVQPGDDAIAKRAGTSGRVRQPAAQKNQGGSQQPAADAASGGKQEPSPAATAGGVLPDYPKNPLATAAERKVALAKWKPNGWKSNDVLKVLCKQFPELATLKPADIPPALTVGMLNWFDRTCAALTPDQWNAAEEAEDAEEVQGNGEEN